MGERYWNPVTSNSEKQTGTDGSSHSFASATSDGIVTKSDSTVLDFNALWIDDGVTGTIVVSRDGGTTSSAPYQVVGPMILPVYGNRVMATGTTITGTNVIWMKW